jgi:hypothetical protein
MTNDKETIRRVQDALYHLQRGLAPFIEGRMTAKHGQDWRVYATRAQGSDPKGALDAYGLLKTIIDNWNDIFRDALPRPARNFASVALDGRNAVSHLTLPLGDDEAIRYLDAMHQLLKAAKASTAEVGHLRKLYDEQRRVGLTPANEAANVLATSSAPAQTALQLPNGETAVPRLRPWVEVALPHPDVIANRFKEAEFAADLFAVDAGLASEDYADPRDFFAKTFLTEGIKRILRSTIERLTDTGGDPVIGLQTPFGGGKTHTMLAVYHLARANDLKLLPGLDELVGNLKAWQPTKTAVFVGTSKGPDVPFSTESGKPVRTLWGYLAWRLAGPKGLSMVGEAEAAGTNPGSERLVEVLKLAAPCVILLDELVAFARQLPDDRFEAFLSFIQSFTEAAKLVPGAMVLGSLPESDAEAGGHKGREALLRLEKIFGRIQSTWMPASNDETYEIIRRRLFQPLDVDGVKARDQTIKAFHDMYRRQAAEFPPEAKEMRYLDLLRLAYPIHPELFDRLSKEWASLPNFQKTRGVLKFMANVVGVLWNKQASDPLIMPARVPIADDKVRSGVLYPLDGAFAAVVDGEVDGEGSLPARMEINPQRRISQVRAASRAARAVFLCSAPIAGQPNAGLTGRGLRLACAEPGDQLAIFGEALRELAERAVFLYEESGRYWFSTQATLNRVADGRARSYSDHEVDEALIKEIRKDAAQRGHFTRVHGAPDDPIEVEDGTNLALIILGPAYPHAGRTAGKSAATDIITDVIQRCRSSQRANRNVLFFAAADENELGKAREAIRRKVAWDSIKDDPNLAETMTASQRRDADDKARTWHESAIKAMRATWSHVFYPLKADVTPNGAAFDLEHLAVTARERASIAAAVYDKCRADGVILERLGPDTFTDKLEQIWPQGQSHLGIRQIADWFSAYPYLPKLRDRVVLAEAIRGAVGKFDSAYGFAESYEEGTGRYHGLSLGRVVPIDIGSGAVLVRRSVAVAQLETIGGVDGTEKPKVPGGGEGTRGEIAEPPAGRQTLRRFYGVVDLSVDRPIPELQKIMESVVSELRRRQGAKVTLTLEVSAEAPSGFEPGDASVIRDNAKTLKFKDDATGFSEN